MDRIIAANSVPSGSADTAPVSGTPQYATDGNPGASQPATDFPAYQYNAIQEELMAIIAAAGIAPDRTNNAQVLAAILALLAANTAPVGTAKNLAGSAAGGTVTASWTVDELVAETALGGRAYKGSSLALAFNGAGTGAGGMDTGAVPTSADLNIYAIYNPTTNTWSTLGTVTGQGAIYSGGHMPAGYTATALIWAGKTDGSSKIAQFTQLDRTISIISAVALTGGSALSPASLSIASIVPAAAKFVAGVASSPSGDQINVASGPGHLGLQTTGATSGAGSSPYGPLLMQTPQTIYYDVNAGTGALLTVSSYSI